MTSNNEQKQNFLNLIAICQGLKFSRLQKIRTTDRGEISLEFYGEKKRQKVFLSLSHIGLASKISSQPAQRSLVFQEIVRRNLRNHFLKDVLLIQEFPGIVLIFDNEKGLVFEWSPEGRFCVVHQSKPSENPFFFLSLVEFTLAAIKTKQRETFKIALTFQNNETFDCMPDIPPQTSLVRRRLKTRERFLLRRLERQKHDLSQIFSVEELKKQLSGLQTVLHLWPEGALFFDVPADVQSWSGLPSRLEISRGAKPSVLLAERAKKLKKSQRAFESLSQRIEESENELKEFDEAKELFESGDEFALVELLKTQRVPKNQNKKRKPLPYRSFFIETGEELRVCKRASLVKDFLKMMPSHHLWFHTVTGQGAHVWLVLKTKLPSVRAKRSAQILALAFSHQQKQRAGDVHEALRGDLSQSKRGAEGEVLVRRSQVDYIQYEEKELQEILKFKISRPDS
jgi:predicted ribosome quality control (RQC) complex YloA/Tae2 family protein